MAVKDDSGMSGIQRTQYLVAASGLLGAVAASSCCILPLVLFSVGVSGAWIGNLTRLAPYQPFFITVTVTTLGCGYWLVYRSSRVACVAGDPTARRSVRGQIHVSRAKTAHHPFTR